jgi:mannonate dehydratase
VLTGYVAAQAQLTPFILPWKDASRNSVGNQWGNAHLDLAVHNFGIQESTQFNQATQDVFPGSPTLKNGYLYVNEAPGLGVDLDEELAKKFPLPENPGYWLPVRRRDGSAVRP